MQLPLDFTTSASQRHRKTVAAITEAQPSLFAAWTPDIDIHLHSPSEAIASIGGAQPELAYPWLSSVVGSVTERNARKLFFPTNKLHLLAWLRPPSRVTLDAAALAVARAQWANAAGYAPLRVTKEGNRLLAASKKGAWPSGMRVSDVPWPAIAACVYLNLPLDVDETALTVLAKRLRDQGQPIASASLAGSTVLLTTTRPDLIEKLNLPALAYDAGHGSGKYKIPLTLAKPILASPLISTPPKVAQAIKQAATRAKPLTNLPADFPWKLYSFQAIDAGRALSILSISGGVLLAGDMGSGKTTVALAIAQTLQAWPALVVAPLTAFSTWSRQLEEMGKTYYLATEPSKISWEKIASEAYEAVVISYDRLPAFVELIERTHFTVIIADEIQRIRTPGSRRSRALRSIASTVPLRVGLSGTPITNTINDILPVGAFLAPSEWSPRASSKDLADIYPGDPYQALTDHLGSMMVRRRMDEIPTNLPKRHDHRIFVPITLEQRKALEDLENTAKSEARSGAFTGGSGRLHAFSRLQQMRKIINSPASAMVPGPNPKVKAAIDLTCDFVNMGRKGVIFCADRAVFTEIGKCLDKEGIGWVGIWGSTPSSARIENEKKFHTDPNIKVVLCTIQAGSESWSASPTATWLITTAYMYSPSALSQMEARVYRMNSDPNGPDIDVCYMHATGPKPTLDDRMLEIVTIKKEIFAQVVDRTSLQDSTKVHMSMQDLMFLLTGSHADFEKKTKRKSKKQ